MIAAAILLAAAAPAACAATDAALPPAYANWLRRVRVTSAGPPLTVGRAVDATLGPLPPSPFRDRPEREPAAGTVGGVFALRIDRPGTYGVALGDRVWVDMLDGGRAVKSVEHGHGPDCSSIRKIVWFTLGRGIHQVQLSGSTTRTVPMMVVAR